MGIEIEPEPAASEAALEYLKQIITLAAGIIAFSGTFIEKVGGLPWYYVVVLLLSWAALVASVLLSLQTISAIIKSRLDKNTNWSTEGGKTLATASKYSFVSGLCLFAIFAFILLVHKKPSEPQHIEITNPSPIAVEIRVKK